MDEHVRLRISRSRFESWVARYLEPTGFKRIWLNKSYGAGWGLRHIWFTQHQLPGTNRLRERTRKGEV